MNKRLIWILLIIVSIALTGLIIFQIYWLINSIEIKENHFSQNVNAALEKVSKKLETRETVLEITNEVYSIREQEDNNNFPFFKSFNNRPQYKTDSFGSNVALSRQTIIMHEDTNPEYDSTISVLSGDSIIYKLNTNPSKNSNSVNYKDIQDVIIKKVNNKSLFVEKIVNKLLNYSDDIHSRVNKKFLQEIIYKELNNNGINLDFEFSVLKKDTIIEIKTNEYNHSTDLDKYNCRLFPNDVFSSPHFLTVYFPKKKNYIIKSLGFMGASSLLLTLAVIFAFGFTIYIIFKQKKLSEIKNDFVNNMTHELKTPISTIGLATQMLKDKSIDTTKEQLKSITKIIDDENKRLSFHVEKVLQVAVFEKSKTSLEFKEININNMLSSSLDKFKLQIEKNNGKINPELKAENPIIMADELHLQNVIYNLLDNAIKYSKENLKISAGTKDSKKGIKFYVKDNGIGMNKSETTKIFDRFYRVSTGNIHDTKGFGLGLSYVKKIIEAHNGTINVKSEINKGTTFEIFLPFKNN